MIADQYRVLVLAPTDSDATLSTSILNEAAMQAHACRDLQALHAQLELGAGALLLTDDVLAAGKSAALVDAL